MSSLVAVGAEVKIRELIQPHKPEPASLCLLLDPREPHENSLNRD